MYQIHMIFEGFSSNNILIAIYLKFVTTEPKRLKTALTMKVTQTVFESNHLSI